MSCVLVCVCVSYLLPLLHICWASMPAVLVTFLFFLVKSARHPSPSSSVFGTVKEEEKANYHDRNIFSLLRTTERRKATKYCFFSPCCCCCLPKISTSIHKNVDMLCSVSLRLSPSLSSTRIGGCFF